MKLKNKTLFSASIFLFVLFALLTNSKGFSEKYAIEIPVLIYHKVSDTETLGQTVVSMEQFKDQMKYLHENGYTTISVKDLVNFMKGASPAPEKSVVLTFDDGWSDVKEIIPILKQFEFKACFFIVTKSGIGGRHLDWQDIIEISENPDFEIGSHSVTHPADGINNLTTWIDGFPKDKTISDAVYELSESKKMLEQKLNKKVLYFAWPGGFYNDTLIKIARDEGYEALLTVDEGTNSRGGNIFRIRRVFVNGNCDLNTFGSLLKNPKNYICKPNQENIKSVESMQFEPQNS